MSNRTSIVILLVALVLFGFIVLYERNTMTTGEVQERDDRLFERFRKGEVDYITLKDAVNQEIQLERTTSPDDFGIAGWAIRGPRALDADPNAVRGILSALDYVLEGRTVAVSSGQESQFGIDQPRLIVSFRIGGETTRFSIGKDAPGEKVYVALVDSPGVLHAVESDLLESLSLTIDDLRNKRLVEKPLTAATKMEITATTTVALERKIDEAWRLRIGEGTVLAADDKVEEVLRTISDLRATSFVADSANAAELANLGLGVEAPRVTVSTPGRAPIVLRYGPSCKEKLHTMLATIEGSGTVVCVDSQLLHLLETPSETLLEKRPLVFRTDDVVGLDFRIGDAHMSLSSRKGPWKIEGEAPQSLEKEEITKFLEEFKGLTARNLVPIPSGAKEHGKIELELRGSPEPHEITLLSDEEGGVHLLRRKGELLALAYEKSLNDLASVSPLTFRSRTILSGDASDVVEVHSWGAFEQKLVKKKGGWRVVSPLEIEADTAGARTLARRITSIEVERWAASLARSEHGFIKPFAELSATIATQSTGDAGLTDLTGSSRFHIQIGGIASGDSRYARLLGDDQSVFVLRGTDIAALSQPSVARNLLQIDSQKTRGISIEMNGVTSNFLKQGDSWFLTGGDDRDSAVVSRIVTDLGAIRVVRALPYGKTRFGATEITCILSVVGDGDVPVRITVGPRSSDYQDKGYVVRRQGIEVDFIWPERLVDDLIKLSSSKVSPSKTI